MPILKPDKEKDANKRPRVLLIPPPDLPVPAVQGGAVETLLTHLIRENEKQGRLDLLCASVPDEAARRAAEGLQHTKMLYVARPHGHRRYWPMVFLERCVGIAAPYDPWYQKVQLSLALELPPPDVIVAEGGNLTQCSAISRMFGLPGPPARPDQRQPCHGYYLRRRAGIKRVHPGRLPAKQQS